MQHIHNDLAVVTIREDASLREAADAMATRSIGSLVVVDEAGAISGILTDRDLCIRAVAVNQDPDKGTVKRAMTSKPVTLPLAATRRERLAAMRSLGIRRVPLVDGHGRPVELVSIDDELQWTTDQLLRLAETTRAGRRHGPFRLQRSTLEELEDRIHETMQSSKSEREELGITREGYRSVIRAKLMNAVDELREDIQKSASTGQRS